MNKIVLVLGVLLAGAANAGTVSVYDSNNNLLVANVQIGSFYQTQSGLEVDLVGVKGRGSCVLNIKSQAEANSLLAAIIAGADVTCSEGVKSSVNDNSYIAKRYTVGKFFSN